MSPSSVLLKKLSDGAYDARFARLYGEEQIAAQRARYADAVRGFVETFGEPTGELMLCSAPGRTEIGGNHTDHNHGRVLAGSVNLDVIAVVAASDEARIRVQSKGYPMDTVLLDELQPVAAEQNHSASLIRGIAARFEALGLSVCGFDAYTTSDVLKGSGLSSSAAFEVMIGNMLSHLYNDGTVDNVEIAKSAQFAENVYFGKPCGLMDQTACAVGGFIAIDFEDPAAPGIEKLDFDLRRMGYGLCIVDTGGNHADLNEDYASVPAEMKAVAKLLGHSVLRECDEEELISKISAVRAVEGDRALLRALHFFGENRRVEKETDALRRKDIKEFFKVIRSSGLSSFCWLQNVYSAKNPREQGLSLALCLTEKFFGSECTDAAWRVHGGGFAGTIQVFVPTERIAEYKAYIEAVFGKGSCHVLSVRSAGAIRVM